MLGKHGGPPVVVRRPTSWLHRTLLIAGVLIGVFALYVVYELGRYNAGYDRQAVAQQRTELEVQIEHLERANRELRTRLRALSHIRLGAAAQGATSVGVKIEQLRITAGQQPASYVVHMSLVRSGRAETPATGSM